MSDRLALVHENGQLEQLQAADVLVRVPGDPYTDYYAFLLDNEPTAETGATDAAYTVTYLGNVVSNETWRRNDTTIIKTLDYTYAANKVATEVRKVYAADGTTVVAQVTWTYTYVGQTLSSAALTRDV